MLPIELSIDWIFLRLLKVDKFYVFPFYVPIPWYFPQIVIIQACQKFHTPDTASAEPSTSSEHDARRTSPEDSKYVVLSRPHTLLLMSTVAGGDAVRGAFTGAIARQFAKADGRVTIDEMVNNAKIDMKKNEGDDYKQTPESRNTLQKSLILPPAGLKQTQRQSHSSQSKIELIERIIGKSSQQP